MKKIIGYTVLFALITISCKNENNNQNKILNVSELEVPEDLKDKVANGKINTYTYQDEFPKVSANFSIIYETIAVDSANSIIKSIKVVLDKGSDNCEFNATIKEQQMNSGTRESYATFTEVIIGYYKESTFSKTSENKVYLISSDGKCKLL